jgi:hypothetical protein
MDLFYKPAFSSGCFYALEKQNSMFAIFSINVINHKDLHEVLDRTEQEPQEGSS